jgi:endonuclease VIII
MPEGHTVHRIARQFARDFVGHRPAVTSPQGRFAAGAALIDGRELLSSAAVGKQLFLTFDGGLVLRVHLGLYGAWDFLGAVSPLDEGSSVAASMGAPRVRRRMGEGELAAELAADDFPPEPVGQVRVRLATEATVADLRGPTACEVLDEAAAAAVLDRLGPDPAVEADVQGGDSDPGARVVRTITAKRTAIGQLLMDQAVVAGIGNIYRAELLFRARLDPHTPGRAVPAETVRAIWDDWAVLLEDGIRTGVMLTREDLDADGRAAALVDSSLRHWVYGRAGEPCRVCGTHVVVEEMAGRKLYFCPVCQR